MAHLDWGYVFLKVTEWFQEIANSNDPEGLEPLGMTLRANCVDSSSNIRLSSNEQFSKLHIDVHLTEGPVLLGNGKPVERGIGLVHYTTGAPSGFGCYIGLAPEHYKEVWAQVRSGAFSECTITLQVAPIDRSDRDRLWDVESNPRLFVLVAQILFRYRPNVACRPAG